MRGHLLKRLVGCRLLRYSGQWCTDLAGGRVISIAALEFDNGLTVELRIETTDRGWRIVPRGTMPLDHPQSPHRSLDTETYP